MNILHWVKFFDKGLEKEHKKEELLQTVKIIKGKNEEQLEVIKDQGKKTIECNYKIITWT